MKPNLYEQTAQFYDFGTGQGYGRDDIDFYLKLFSSGQSVLELGYGTGRAGIQLAEAGVFVAGLDLSEPMLSIYRSKVPPALAGQIAIFRGDMTDFGLSKKFDGIIFPLRAFQALTSDTARLACLKCVRGHMGNASRAVICMFNPHPEILKNWGMKGIVDFDVPWSNEHCYLRRISDQVHHDSEQQVIVSDMVYQKYVGSKVLEESRDRFELGYLYPEQARALISKAGLRVEAEYGHYDLRPIRDGEFREQIFVLRMG